MGINEDKKYKLHIMKALGWYLKINHLKKSDIARNMNVHRSVLTKMTISPQLADDINLDNVDGKVLISMETAIEMCSAMGTTLQNVLFAYQFKAVLKDAEKVTALLSVANSLKDSCDEISNLKMFTKDGIKRVLVDVASTINNNLITDAKNPLFNKWIGKYYCYFSSTSSDEAGKQREEYDYLLQTDSADQDSLELYQKTASNYIFCGIMEVHDSKDDPYCHVDFRFLSNPQKGIIKRYTGLLTLSKSTKAVFCELSGFEQGEKSYFITEQQDLGDEYDQVRLCIAMVLTYSSRMEHRRPCCERMIISSKPIDRNSALYDSIKAHLHMNDNCIRITQWGYEQLIDEINNSEDGDLHVIKEIFPNLQSLKGHTIPIEQCAFIPESVIYNLNVLSETQKMKFEILLRNHSIAPWYCKTKGKKAVDLFRIANDA